MTVESHGARGESDRWDSGLGERLSVVCVVPFVLAHCDSDLTGLRLGIQISTMAFVLLAAAKRDSTSVRNAESAPGTRESNARWR